MSMLTVRDDELDVGDNELMWSRIVRWLPREGGVRSVTLSSSNSETNVEPAPVFQKVGAPGHTAQEHPNFQFLIL